jgi:hypothetical protein
MLVFAALVVLVVGDFGSTFFYHVPAHLWFRLHLRTHHDNRRSYADHAVLSTDPQVLLDGFLGAIPYLLMAAWDWHSGKCMCGGGTPQSWGGALPRPSRQPPACFISSFPRTTNATTETPA